ncbi:methylitaconate delta2-delta3-isomerase [Rhexocercosporidium sp. MPI-PUGE-AT-0058]|nr:methylitaconate delta2-delta3-isomerase [Rhexocercosporidium sp. MPI-PUGE-AT-0058]
MEQQVRTRHVLPSVMMRCGTSKGLFLHRRDLPQDKSLWNNVLLAAMGSRDGDVRQLDGVGGATSTTSKVAIVSKSTRPGIDVDYTFAQVGVGSSKVDFSGNCGNICSGVGPFALDEGLVVPAAGQTEMEVSIFNTNTSRKIVETVKVGPDGKFCEFGDHRIGGVKGTASKIEVAFVNPAGSMTGKLLPTGLPQETLHASSTPGIEPFTVNVSMVDAANPFVFVDASTMPKSWQSLDRNDPLALEIVEVIRRIAAVRMGLASDEISAAQVRGTPKIAVLSQAEPRAHDEATPDIHVTSYSMGKMHPSFQLTGAVCLGAAISIPGTVASDIAERQRYPTPPGTPEEKFEEANSVKNACIEKEVVIEHASGEITARVKSREDGMDGLAVESVTVSRTARRLFEGNVLINV